MRTCDQLKSLNCGHQYCKDYVNGNVDDDGEFQCSLGCTEKIAVEKHDTTPSPTASLTDDFKEKNKITGYEKFKCNFVFKQPLFLFYYQTLVRK